MKNYKTAIILVNYKGYAKGYLADCYASLMAQSNLDFDLFIADNSSDAETIKAITKLAPKAKIIANTDNLGWAGGNNSVIKNELNNFDYFILLNMDTVLDKNWLKELLEYMGKNNHDIAQSKILIHDKEIINSLGNRINYLGFGFCNCYKKKVDCTIESESCQVDYTSGASMIVKKDVFEKIGLFREEFFMYHDDLEFCWRARLAGFTLGIAEKSICHHKYSFKSTMNLIYYMERNRLITLFSLIKIPTLLLILPMLIPFEFAMLIYMGITGNFLSKIRSMAYFFTPTGIKLIAKIRKEVKAYRVTGDRKIYRTFAGKVEFEEIKNPILDYLANPVLNFYWKIVRTLIVW